MSTRSTTHFIGFDGETEAIVYRHSDGYPEGHGRDLQTFFAAVESQTDDHRYGDAPYLAAKLVVYLADQFAVEYLGDGKYQKSEPLDFLSVGVMMTDPGDIEYLYEIDCNRTGPDGRPLVRCYEVDHDADGAVRKGEEVSIEAVT